MSETLTRGQKAVRRVREKKDKKGTALQHPCMPIQVSELLVGDEIGKVFAFDKYGEKVITKSEKVTDIDECRSQWRTHIHVNKRDCYDIRQFVTIKK